jgi:hypothetical protein
MIRISRLRQVAISVMTIFYLLTFSPGLTYAHSQVLGGTNQVNVTNCPSPPANFSPLRASASEINYYGLRPRPQGNAKELAKWVDLMKHAKHRECNFTNSYRYSQPLSSQLHPLSTSASYSQIWSGWLVGSGSGSGFNRVDAYWNVPCYNSSHSPSSSRAVTWIGLGGWYGNNLWQGGTTEDPSTGYHLWWEAYPANYMQISAGNLSCGDQIYAGIDYNYDYANEASIYLQDETHGTYYILHAYYNNWKPNLESAEWIDERSGCSLTNSSHYLLGDFNYVQWSSAEAVPNYSGAGWGSISAFANTQFTMYEANSPFANLTNPGSLTSGGYNFRDSWIGNGNDNTC